MPPAWMIVVALLGATSDASPQVGAPPPTTTPSAEAAVWYGAPAVAMDAAATGLVVGAFAVGDKTTSRLLGILGVTGAVMVPPFNHLWSGHRSRVDTSFGLRLAAAAVGTSADLYLAGKFDRCSGEVHAQQCGTWEEMAVLAPLAVAMIIDDAFLSRAPPMEPPHAMSRLAPVLQVGEDRTVLSVAGAF